ncbi:hypothetical protein R3P38DRAFT_2888266 [Favolaschia claudopus]|uniref:F-box domain-containing protein n=1 Tax=Favolaschia claudopus TaxID=2862362 RepID=A0AAW0CV09_9AGAR
MPDPSLSVPELWEQIIGFLPTSSKCADLKAVALVCRSFTSPAQRGVFHTVSFVTGNRWLNGRQHDELAESARRFADIIESSPHILSYVYHLRLHNADPGCYHALAAIPWSHLRQLYVQYPLPPEAKPDLTRLIGLPSLRELDIRTWGDHPIDILSSCSTSLETLTIAPEYQSKPPEAPPRSYPRPKILDLKMNGTKPFIGYITDLFDLTSLKTLEWWGLPCPDLDRFFLEYGQTVETLNLSDLRDAAWDNLSLSYFPSVTSICTLSKITRRHNKILDTLPLDNRVLRLSFYAERRTPNEEIQDIARDLEEVVLTRLMAVRSVEFTIRSDEFASEAMRSLFPTQRSLVDRHRELFPRLRERKLLSVCIEDLKLE